MFALKSEVSLFIACILSYAPPIISSENSIYSFFGHAKSSLKSTLHAILSAPKNSAN
jgi:hypothetical protein